jgi:staphylococcal nuclease domain-containing protein 1
MVLVSHKKWPILKYPCFLFFNVQAIKQHNSQCDASFSYLLNNYVQYNRMASKANSNVDEPGAFPAREWLRLMVVGKMVNFETRKQGASAGDRVYGWLSFTPPGDAMETINISVQAVKSGNATPKSVQHNNGNIPTSTDDNNNTKEGDHNMHHSDDAGEEYQKKLIKAYEEAKEAKVGIHAALPLVRSIKNAGDDFATLALVQSSQKLGPAIKCVIEYIFDASRFRCQVTDPCMGELQYASFTVLLAGVSAPRLGNPRAEPPTSSEEFAEDAKQFVELRMLQRELEITLHGTDKSGICAVGTVHHPKGNIAVELLKSGLAKMSDWSVRLMSPSDVPALRIAENTAKRTNTGIWHAYAAPQISGASEIFGTVVEVLTGDTVAILPNGEEYDSEAKLRKISLSSIRAPRAGNERLGRADEAYSYECKDRLRVMTVGKPCKIEIHYERDIPMGENTERRQFGSISLKNKPDIAEVLVAEGLATTQRHRDADETSPRYDELRAAEAIATAAKKGVHSEVEYKRGAFNDLSDPRKAKAYSGSLMRAGSIKAIVEYCFNGARFKMLIPAENCHIVFAPDVLRCPQPSPNPGSKQTKPAEPFGDASKRHARLTVHQRIVEIVCTGVTMGGVITGSMYIGQGEQRRDYSLELVASGLATVDQRKIDYGEAPKHLIDAQAAAERNRVGIWSIDRPMAVQTTKTSLKFIDQISSIRVSEIRSGSHFFYHNANDEAGKVIEDSMALFTKNNGIAGGPCDVKAGKVVAALFDDGTGKSWYRAKIVERSGGAKATVLFVDHGNMASVPIATHLRPLDITLGTDRIPPVAKEAVLGLTVTKPISSDEGVEAARMFQSLVWGKDIAARIHGTDETGKIATSLITESGETVNEMLVSAGLALVCKPVEAHAMAGRMVDGTSVLKLAADLEVAKEVARKTRSGMWRYGDVDFDEDAV